MRVIECNECGETMTGADDAELAHHLADHLRDEHELQPGDEEVADLMHEQAYDAMDS